MQSSDNSSASIRDSADNDHITSIQTMHTSTPSSPPTIVLANEDGDVIDEVAPGPPGGSVPPPAFVAFYERKYIDETRLAVPTIIQVVCMREIMRDVRRKRKAKK